MNRQEEMMINLDSVLVFGGRHGHLDKLLADELISDVSSHALQRSYKSGYIAKAVQRAWEILHAEAQEDLVLRGGLSDVRSGDQSEP